MQSSLEVNRKAFLVDFWNERRLDAPPSDEGELLECFLEVRE